MTRRYMTDQDAENIRRLAAQGFTSSQIGREIGADPRRVGEWAARIGVAVRRISAPKYRVGPWTEVELQVIRDRYQDEPAGVIAEDLGRTRRALMLRANLMGLRKSEAFHRSEHTGRRKPKGQSRYMRDGDWRVSRGFLEKKTGPRKWQTATLAIWLEHNPPPPAGMVAVWRPGMATTDPAVATIDRIELVTRAELMRRNSLHTRYPPEVTRLIQINGALKRKIKDLLRESGNEQHTE